MSRTFAILLALAAIGVPGRAENVDPESDGSQFAWSENLGWINAEPAGDGGDGLEVGDFEITGWLWSENCGWISATCANTASCDAVEYGVRNDGRGLLSGRAWSVNLGWIDFGPSDAGVTIDPATGLFDGFAWSENAGWIRFASGGEHPFAVKTGWRCDPPPAPPGGSPRLALDRSDGAVELTWTGGPGATGADLVRGDLATLRASGGGFDLATVACLADNRTTPALRVPEDPAPGEGLWFLVRPVNCGGRGSYDTGSSSQNGSRDAGIAGSGNDCP